MSQVLTRYANKEIPLQYEGRRISFFLSQALFSSYDIDQGSRLLLKSISGTVDFSRTRRVLDIGCGVGTLGLTLKKRHPGIELVLQDRDALAVEFTHTNAERNGITDIAVLGGLAFEGLEFEGLAGGGKAPERPAMRLFDLIVSNVPAKVGTPVLRHFFRRMLAHLTDDGTAVIVVVNPIADITSEMLMEAGAAISLLQKASGHTVFHFTHGEKRAPAADIRSEGISSGGGSIAEEEADSPRTSNLPYCLIPYIRSRITCTAAGVEYDLDTVWGEADFDTPPYTAALVAKSLKTIPAQASITFWNPGQGHIPVLTTLLMRDKGAEPLHVCCAGRDMLALRITAHNLRRSADFPEENLEIQHTADPGCMHGLQAAPDTLSSGLQDLLVVESENLAGVPNPEAVLSAAEKLLRPGGFLLVSGKSAHIHRFFSVKSPFTRYGEKKHRGYRVVALKRL